MRDSAALAKSTRSSRGPPLGLHMESEKRGKASKEREETVFGTREHARVIRRHHVARATIDCLFRLIHSSTAAAMITVVLSVVVAATAMIVIAVAIAVVAATATVTIVLLTDSVAFFLALMWEMTSFVSSSSPVTTAATTAAAAAATTATTAPVIPVIATAHATPP